MAQPPTGPPAGGPLGSTIREHVADAVVEQMRVRDVTQEFLANRTGIPRTTLLRKLNGHRAFDVDELERVARVLEVDPASFMPETTAGMAS